MLGGILHPQAVHRIALAIVNAQRDLLMVSVLASAPHGSLADTVVCVRVCVFVERGSFPSDRSCLSCEVEATVLSEPVEDSPRPSNVRVGAGATCFGHARVIA